MTRLEAMSDLDLKPFVFSQSTVSCCLLVYPLLLLWKGFPDLHSNVTLIDLQLQQSPVAGIGRKLPAHSSTLYRFRHWLPKLRVPLYMPDLSW